MTRRAGAADGPTGERRSDGASAADDHRIKSLGQHFLRDPRILRRILEAAGLAPGERVLEVGAGGGILTEGLLAAVGPEGKVVAFEVDPRWADRLAAAGHAHLRVRRGDVLDADLADPDAVGRFDAIVSNLPYQISGPVTVRFLEMLDRNPWRCAVLMFQKEFAGRLLAGPGTKAYGRLSVHVARRCRVEKVTDASPACFDPSPKVHSTVVRLVPHDAPPFQVEDEALWRAVVDGTFQKRRKQLRNSLPAAVAHRIPGDVAVATLETLGWSSRRPEELAPADFARLTQSLLRTAA